MGCCSSASAAQVRGSRLPAARPDASPALHYGRPPPDASCYLPSSLKPTVHSRAPHPASPARLSRRCRRAGSAAADPQAPPCGPQCALSSFPPLPDLASSSQSHLSGPSRPPAGRGHTGASSAPGGTPFPRLLGLAPLFPAPWSTPSPHPPTIFCAPRRSTSFTPLPPYSSFCSIRYLSVFSCPPPPVRFQVFKRAPEPFHGPLPRSHPLASHPIPPLCLDRGTAASSHTQAPAGAAETGQGMGLGTWRVTGALRKLPLCCQCNRRKRCRI